MSRITLTPGKIERHFRRDLGDVNPHMCIVDVAVSSLLKQARISSQDDLKFITETAKEYNHPRLHIEKLNICDVSYFVYISHVTFINSRAELACKQVRQLEGMLKKAKEHAEGDFLRKTIYVIKASKEGKEKLDKATAVDEEINSIVGTLNVSIIDYFRELRNTQIHMAERESKNIKEARRHVSDEEALREYGASLSASGLLTASDILLLSKVWQKVIKDICRNCLDNTKVYQELKELYRGISNKERRLNKIRQTLKQEYLQTDSDIKYLMYEDM